MTTLYGGVSDNPGGGGYVTPAPGSSGGGGSIGLGTIGNLLLGYLNNGNVPGGLVGMPAPGSADSQRPPFSGGVPVTVPVNDPGTPTGDIGSGNNSGNSYESNTITLPGFGNVTFNAPNLPAIQPAQFGNSPPLSLIAALGNPNFSSGGYSAPSYDTNVGSSGSVQGAPGQMMETRRDSPGGPARPTMEGGAPQVINTPDGGRVVLSSRGGAQSDMPPQAPPRLIASAGGVGGPVGGGAPPGMPPMPPPANIGGGGATESQAALFKRLKDKLKAAYQRGEITPEEMNALGGAAEAPSAAPQKPAEVTPPPAVSLAEPEQLPWETDASKVAPYGANHPALVGDPRARNQAALQARAQRDERIAALEDYFANTPNPSDMSMRRAQLEAAYKQRATHPTGLNSPLVNGVVSRWNRWKLGPQADPRNAGYFAQEQIRKEMASDAHREQVAEYNKAREMLQALHKERDADLIHQEDEDRTNQEQQAEKQTGLIADQRRDWEKRLNVMDPSTPEGRKAKIAEIQRGIDAGYVAKQNTGALNALLYGYDKVEAEKQKLDAEAKRQDIEYNRSVKLPSGKLKYESAQRLMPTKEEIQRLTAEQKRLDNEKKRFDNGKMDEREAAKFTKEVDAHNKALQDMAYKDYLMAGGAVEDYDKQLTLDARRTAGGMIKPGQLAGMGITDPVQKAAAIKAEQAKIQGQLDARAKALEARSAARERAMSANVAQAVQQGDPNKAYYEQVKTSLADGSHSRAELEAGLAKRGLSIKTLEAKYGPIGKPGAR